MMARHRKPSVQWVACLVLFAVAGCISAEASGSVLTVPLRGLFETCFALPGQYANPFNASLILVQATFHTPSPTSDVEVVDGFWFQNYTHSLVNNVEELTAHGPPQWCVRYSPRVLGTYTYTINATDGLGSNVTNPSQFECTTEGAGAGFVAVAANQQHFAEVGTATPTTYWPVGENVAWTNATGTFAWHNYFQRMSKYGANYARLWLTDEYLGDVLALQTTLGRYNLGNAWRLDVVMALARRFGMRTLMCTESFNLLCVDTCPFCKWPSSLFNVKNGGNLNQPQDFFTNPQSKALYKQRLRYLVARYGWDSSVFAWEFFNEVDVTQAFNVSDFAPWANEMSTYLRSIDIYKHPISSSFSNPLGQPTVDGSSALDFTMTHTYGAKDMVENTLMYNALKATYKKPTYVAEFGNGNGYKPNQPDGTDDPTGIYLNNGYWGGAASLGAGGCMSWWWDTYIDPAHLYWRYAGISTFSRIVPWLSYTWASGTIDASGNTNVRLVGVQGSQVARRARTATDGFDAAVVLAQSLNFTWAKQAAGMALNPMPAQHATVRNCIPQRAYTARWFNTTTGAAISTKAQTIVCSSAGELSVVVPPLSQEAACLVEATTAASA